MTTQDCPDCAVAPGACHLDGCDVERCAACGRQRVSCECGRRSDALRQTRLPWTGEWPGVADCRDLGWYCRRAPDGWQRCEASAPGATEDLNRLATDEARWNVKRHRFETRG